MGMKIYAIGVTNEALNEAAKLFGEDPSSIAWARLGKAMKAHQFANFKDDAVLEPLLRDVPREETVRVLAKAFDADLTQLSHEVAAGLAKLIAA
jgi:hypothetical protein